MSVRIHVECDVSGEDFAAPGQGDPRRCECKRNMVLFDDMGTLDLLADLRKAMWDVVLPGKRDGITLCPWHSRTPVECPTCYRRDGRHESRRCTGELRDIEANPGEWPAAIRERIERLGPIPERKRVDRTHDHSVPHYGA